MLIDLFTNINASVIENYMYIVWIGVFIIALIIELVTTELVSIWFSGSAFVTALLSFIPGLPFWGEILIFVGLSAIFLFALRPLTKKYFTRNKIKSNVDELIGQRVILTKDITLEEYGETKIHGNFWRCESLNKGETIEKGEEVQIVSIDGNKLVVKVIKEEK